MANSYVTYTGNASTTQFSITFNYIASTVADPPATPAGILVYLDSTLQTTGYTINTTTNVVDFASAPGTNVAIKILRSTPKLKTGRLVDFQDGSILTEADLDTSALQLLYISQESFEQSNVGESGFALLQAITVTDSTTASIAFTDFLDNDLYDSYEIHCYGFSLSAKCCLGMLVAMDAGTYLNGAADYSAYWGGFDFQSSNSSSYNAFAAPRQRAYSDYEQKHAFVIQLPNNRTLNTDKKQIISTGWGEILGTLNSIPGHDGGGDDPEVHHWSIINNVIDATGTQKIQKVKLQGITNQTDTAATGYITRNAKAILYGRRPVL